MTVRIHVESEQEFEPHRPTLRAAAAEALQQAGVQDAELTLILTGNSHIQELNRQYREQDQITDVLAFPYGEPDPDSGLNYLGDVVISLPQARSQAQQAGHDLKAELSLLAVHGVLHLLGHDHADAAAKEEMWARQSRALAALGFDIEDPAQR